MIARYLLLFAPTMLLVTIPGCGKPTKPTEAPQWTGGDVYVFVYHEILDSSKRWYAIHGDEVFALRPKGPAPLVTLARLTPEMLAKFKELAVKPGMKTLGKQDIGKAYIARTTFKRGAPAGEDETLFRTNGETGDFLRDVDRLENDNRDDPNAFAWTEDKEVKKAMGLPPK